MGFFDFNVLSILTVENILWLIISVVLGLIVGTLPGLGAAVGCALLLPITYTMNAATACVAMMALFMASQYGGSVSAVTLGIPGTSGAVVTVMDGNPLAKQGKPGLALGYSLYSSTIGGILGCVALVFLTRPLAKAAIYLADPELFLVGMLALLCVPALGSKNARRCVISIALGLFTGCIGLDAFTGSERFTFGNVYMADGLSIVAMLSGLFALSEVWEMVAGDLKGQTITDSKALKCYVPMREFKKVIPTISKSSVIGILFGICPGLGASAATFVAYGSAKSDAPAEEKEKFGKGSVWGLAAAESCNNAVVGGALIPELALGIPGTSTLAIMGSALMMHGIQPGPNLFNGHPELVYTLYYGLFAATILMFIFGRFLTPLIAQVLRCPNYILAVIVTVATLVGAQAARSYDIDVWMAFGCGIIVFFMKRLDFNIPAFTMGMVLAALIEDRFRRALLYTRGSASVFFTRPLCWILWLAVLWMVWKIIRGDKKKVKTEK